MLFVRYTLVDETTSENIRVSPVYLLLVIPYSAGSNLKLGYDCLLSSSYASEKAVDAILKAS